MKLKTLVGAGDHIGLLVLPFLVVGLALNVLRPALFGVGGPPAALRALSIAVLIPGGIAWIWSVVLILTEVPKRRLITSGPFVLVKHPLYTAVSLLVLPWVGFLLDSWLGAVLGVVLYVASRLFAPEEERMLAQAFGPAWDEYRRSVKIGWL
ncbi:MAG TPA: isoprenylcysteine carboxylmethyltransferase family protein [Coriobacteriia bacterium]|jgi:protein-S-isoprenylcysteine O-methyltransferase Ste14